MNDVREYYYEYHTDDKKLVVLVLPDQLSKEDVEDFKTFINIIIKQMERRAK